MYVCDRNYFPSAHTVNIYLHGPTHKDIFAPECHLQQEILYEKPSQSTYIHTIRLHSLHVPLYTLIQLPESFYVFLAVL